MAVDAGAVSALAEARAAETRGLLERLVARPSPYGSSGAAAQDALADFLTAYGFACERLLVDPADWAEHPEYTPPPAAAAAGDASRPAVNLSAEPAGAEVPPRVVLFGHVDTEPAPDGDAGEAEVRDARLRGVGAADDKGGLAAAAVVAGVAWQAWGLPVRLLSVHGKGGGARGTLAAFAEGRLSGGEVALYVHPAETGRGLAEIKHRSRGVADLTIRVEGWRGSPREIGTPESAPFDAGGNAVVAATELFHRLRRRLSADCELNLGRLEGGDAVGTVPRDAVMRVRALFDGGTAAELARRAGTLAREWAGESAGERRYGVEVRRQGLSADPAEVDWDAPLCRLLREAVTEVTGEAPSPYRGHLASDIRFPIRVAGVPSVGLGPVGGDFYSAGEWVDLDDLERCVAVLLLAVHRLGTGSRD